MATIATITQKDNIFPEGLNYDALRAEGLKHIQNFSGDLWTDHNIHDPGITVLEALCYVLTDLVYRNQLDIEDLLARNKKLQQPEDNFFTAAEILSCNPLTILDLRKLLLDIPGIRNAWLEIADNQEVALLFKDGTIDLSYTEAPEELVLNGLYQVWLELDSIPSPNSSTGACEANDELTSEIIDEVKRRLHGHRNLCEDYLDISILKDEEIGICGDLELHANADPEETLIEVFEKIQEFLSPTLFFYSLQELLQKGKTTDEIFEGRPLTKDSHGFIDTGELQQLDLRVEIHASDVYHEILKVPGVRAIRRLFLFNCIAGEVISEGKEWCLPLTKGYRPILSPAKSKITFYKGKLPFKPNSQAIQEAFDNRLSNFRKVKRSENDLDLSIPNGVFRSDLSDYHSIQHDFPLNYGIGEGGLPIDASKIRKGQAFQLKAYLLFFDQMLANYLGQLGQVRDLFSMTPDENRAEAVRKTRFSKGLENVPMADKLIRFFNDSELSGDLEQGKVIALSNDGIPFSSSLQRDMKLEQLMKLTKGEQYQVVIEEVECGFLFRIANRFGEVFLVSKSEYETEKEALEEANILNFLGSQTQSYHKTNDEAAGNYSFEFIYNPISYIEYLDQISESKEAYYQSREHFLNHLLARFAEEFTDYVVLMFALEGKRKDAVEIIKDKTNFLSNYPDISRNRGRAFNYKDGTQTWDTKNISGFENRVAALMGINDFKRQTLCNFQVIKRKDLYYIELLDYRENVLFTSHQGFLSDDKTDYQDQLLNLAAHPEYYQDVDCIGDSIYGFNLVDEEGCLFACHSATYATAEKRNKKKEFLIQTINEKGWGHTIESTPAGFYFDFKGESGKILFKSCFAYHTEEEAWEALEDLIDLLKDFELYKNEDDFSTKQHSFFIENGDGIPVARHSGVWDNVIERDQKKYDIYCTLVEKELDFEIIQSGAFYGWCVKDEAGEILLSSYLQMINEDGEINASTCFFKTASQALSAYVAFFNELSDGEFILKPDFDSPEEWYFYFEQEPELCTARSKAYRSEKARTDSMETIGDHIVDIGEFQEEIQSLDSAIQYELNSKDVELTFKSIQLFRSIGDAVSAWSENIPLARYSKYYGFQKSAGLCNIRIVLCDAEGLTVAVSENQFSTQAEARSAILLFVRSVRRKNILFSTVENLNAFEFVLPDEMGTVLLKSKRLYTQKVEALFAYLQLVTMAPTVDFFSLTETAKPILYGFEVRNQKNQVIAFSNIQDSDIDLVSTKMEEAISTLAKLTPAFGVVEKPGSYSFNLLNEKGNISLKGLERFAQKGAALKAFFTMTNLVENGDNVVNVEEDILLKSFAVADNGKLIAQYPFFLIEEELMVKKTNIINYITAAACDVDVQFEDKKYWFVLKWESCNDSCQTLFRGTSMDLETDAEQNYVEFKEIWKQYCNDLDAAQAGESVPVPIQPVTLADGTYSIQFMNGEDVVATHPFKYTTQAARDHIEADAIEFLKTDEYTWNCFSNIHCHKYGMSEDVKEPDSELIYGFRLMKENQFFAYHPKKYHSCEAYKVELDRILNDAKKGRKDYSEIMLGGEITCKIGEYFFYQLKEANNNELLWQSTEGYGTSAEAEAAFLDNFIKIIHLAKAKDRYLYPDVNDGLLSIKLQDEQDNIIAQLPVSINDDWRQIALRNQDHALFYPFRPENEGICFGILNKERYELDWKSTGNYSTFEEVVTAFRHFCNLLLNPNNIIPTGGGQAGHYSFALGEILLESAQVYEDKDETKKGCTAWDSIRTSLLKHINEPYNLRRFSDYSTSCGKSFLVVDNEFDLACHPWKYETPLQREVVRDYLFQQANCELLTCSDVSQQICCKNERYYFQILDEATPGLILWQSVEGFPSKEAAISAYSEQYISIVNDAKESENYRIRKNADDKYLVQLANDKGSITVEVPARFEETEVDERIAAIKSRVKHARLFPFFEKEGQYGFQLYDCDFDRNLLKSTATAIYYNNTKLSYLYPADTLSLPKADTQEDSTDDCICIINNKTTNSIEIHGATIWLSKNTYSSFDCAKEYLDLFKRSLKKKTSYLRRDETDCGPFCIDLVNRTGVIARHPSSYSTETELERAIEQTLSCINAEGLHLVEHILLRPKTRANQLYTIQLVKKETVDSEEGTPILSSYLQFVNEEEATEYKVDFLNKTKEVVFEILSWTENIVEDASTDSVFKKGFLDGLYFLEFLNKLDDLKNIPEGDPRLIFFDRDRTTDISDWTNVTNFITLFETGTGTSPDAADILTRLMGVIDYAGFVADETLLQDLNLLFESYDIQRVSLSVASTKEILKQFHTNNRSVLDLYYGEERLTKGLCYYSSIEALQSDLDLIATSDEKITVECIPYIEENTQFDLFPNCTLYDSNSEEEDDINKAEACNEIFIESDVLYSKYIPGADPYSFWISVVIPYWPERFQNSNFRQFFEQVLRKEIPAHIALKICWVTPKQMHAFEEKYRNWLEAISGIGTCKYTMANNRLIKNLLELRTEYVPAQLHDCENGGGAGSIVYLGQTTLG